jgi:diguanylate cyclase (GGDEF)-like protein
MLTYTYVTDIVTCLDELQVLRAALDNVDEGIALLDEQLYVRFMNRAVRSLWGVSDAEAESNPPYQKLVGDSRLSHAYGIEGAELDTFIENRIASIRAGDSTPQELPVKDGRVIRSHCAPLPAGGRMLTYTDVTDLVHQTEVMRQLATTDTLTGIFNRRHFATAAETEWARFQRYMRPLSLLLVDIDNFKSINDLLGHDVGDQALLEVAAICSRDRRTSDVVARLGGDEFAVLLPETDAVAAKKVADRLCGEINAARIKGTSISASVSIGVAEAQLSMPGFGALMKDADVALYQAKEGGRNKACYLQPAGELKVAAE